jgi:chitodextrinase
VDPRDDLPAYRALETGTTFGAGGERMKGRFRPSFAVRLLGILLALGLTLGAAPPSNRARDWRPPTTPTNLRVTAVSSYSVSLTWSPSTDNSGFLSYRIHASNGQTISVSQATTSYTFSSGLLAGYSYSFTVYAVDGSGNRSRNSNTVTATLPMDRTPPTVPVLSLTGMAPTRVSLAWTSSVDDGPYVFYQTYVNGVASIYVPNGGTSADITGLAPLTTYTFTVVAGDTWNNRSAPSNAVTVTTPASDPGDTTPPTTPADLYANDGGCGEVWLFWAESTDNVDAQAEIRYLVYVNGTLDATATVVGQGGTILYVTADGHYIFEVVAVDAAGNRSAPAATSLDLVVCDF